MTRKKSISKKAHHTSTSPKQTLYNRNCDLILTIIRHQEQGHVAHTLNSSTSAVSKYLKLRGTNFKTIKHTLDTWIQLQKYTSEHKDKLKQAMTETSPASIFFSHASIITAIFLTTTTEEIATLLEIPLPNLLNYLHQHQLKPTYSNLNKSNSPTSVEQLERYDDSPIQADADTNWHTLPGSSLNASSLPSSFFASPFEHEQTPPSLPVVEPIASPS